MARAGKPGTGWPGRSRNLIRRVLMGRKNYETCLNRTCGPVPARTALRDRRCGRHSGPGTGTPPRRGKTRTAIGVEAEWEKVRAGLVNYIDPVALID